VVRSVTVCAKDSPRHLVPRLSATLHFRYGEAMKALLMIGGVRPIILYLSICGLLLALDGRIISQRHNDFFSIACLAYGLVLILTSVRYAIVPVFSYLKEIMETNAKFYNINTMNNAMDTLSIEKWKITHYHSAIVEHLKKHLPHTASRNTISTELDEFDATLRRLDQQVVRLKAAASSRNKATLHKAKIYGRLMTNRHKADLIEHFWYILASFFFMAIGYSSIYYGLSRIGSIYGIHLFRLTVGESLLNFIFYSVSMMTGNLWNSIETSSSLSLVLVLSQNMIMIMYGLIILTVIVSIYISNEYAVPPDEMDLIQLQDDLRTSLADGRSNLKDALCFISDLEKMKETFSELLERHKDELSTALRSFRLEELTASVKGRVDADPTLLVKHLFFDMSEESFLREISTVEEIVPKVFVTHDVLAEKMKYIEKYDAHDVFNLLEQLRQGSLSQPYGWLQALKSQYNSGRYRFTD